MTFKIHAGRGNLFKIHKKVKHGTTLIFKIHHLFNREFLFTFFYYFFLIKCTLLVL